MNCAYFGYGCLCPECQEKRKMEPDPCRSEVEKVEIVIPTCIWTEEGEVVSRHQRVHLLDPTQFNLNQTQQIEREYGQKSENWGVPIRQQKIGKPFLVLCGTVIGGRNEPLLEPRHPDLDIGVEKIANVIKILFIWKGKEVLEYSVTEQALLVENMRHHTGLMIDKLLAKIGREDISPGQIRHGLMVAVGNHMGIPIDQR